MKEREFCYRPEGVRCPDFFDQCSFCKWVDQEAKEIRDKKIGVGDGILQVPVLFP